MLIFAALFKKNKMKKFSLGLIVMLLALASCGGKSQQVASTNEMEGSAEEVYADGIQRLREYNYHDTLRTNGHTYIYTIHREYSDSLPTVTDDEGNRHADNIYTLTIASDGRTFFNRRFTKSTFASYLSAEMAQKGILDGMMCDTSLPGLRFAISVSLPQSDMFEPLLMQVDANGGISITRDERGDEAFETDEDGV